MKFLVLGLMLVGAVKAGTLVQLPNPAMPVIVNPHWMHCASIGFGADSSVYGACQVNYSSCSGRYCHSPSMFFAMTWDQRGADPVLGAVCARIPGGMGVAKITYEPGYDATNCRVSYDPTGTVIITGGYPFYYVNTDPVTGAELLNSNVQSYLYAP